MGMIEVLQRVIQCEVLVYQPVRLMLATSLKLTPCHQAPQYMCNALQLVRVALSFTASSNVCAKAAHQTITEDNN
jgi:hypothetical protein